MMRDFVDVEGKLRLDVLVLAFGIVDRMAVLSLELVELHRHRKVGGQRMPVGIADVMRKSADGKRKLIGIAGVAEEIQDEIAGAHVMSKVAERHLAEGIVADVLDDAAAVGVGPGFFQLALVRFG